MGLLYMRDYVNLRVTEVEPGKKTLEDCKDGKSPSGKSLLVKVEATHSGIVNGNHRFYRPDRMQECTHQWVQEGRALKPVLVQHDKDGAAIGRVQSARYIDLSHKYRADLPEISNLLFYADAAVKRFDLFKSINTVLDKLQTRDDYRGLGYIELGMNITNPDAIRKVLSGEYLTVSVGFQTDQAICSACHTDWAVDDRCDHSLGEMVDGKKMFLIAGNFFYKECSFVNFPADPFAQVISTEMLRDHVENRMFFMGMRREPQAKLLAAFAMADSVDLAKIYESDIQVADPDNKDSEMLVELQSYLDEMNKAPLTRERSIELLDKVNKLEPKEDTEKEAVRRVQTTLKAHIQKHGLESVADTKVTKEQIEAKIESLIPTLQDMAEDARVGYIASITAEAKAFELEVPVIDVKNLAIKPADKPVLADSVKNLLTDLHKLDTFAFDDAKIPADTLTCMDGLNGHYTAADDQGKSAMRYSLYAHLCDWQASSQRGYAISRVKEIEDAVNKDAISDIVLTDAETKAPLMIIGAGLKSEMGKGFVPKGASDSYTALHKVYSASDAEGKSHITRAAGALLEHWHSGSVLEYHRKLLAPGTGQEVKDGVVLTKEEHDTLMTGQEKLETQLAATRTELDALKNQNISLVKSLKKDRATTLVAVKVLTGETGFQGLTETQIKDKVAEREQRSLASLRDALNDELGKLSGFEFQAGSSTVKPEEVGAKTVADSATIKPNESTTVTDSAAAAAAITEQKLPKDPKAARAVRFYQSRITPIVEAPKE